MSNAVLQEQKEKTEPILESFLAISQARMQRVQNSLSARKQSFLDALPMLFHDNEKLLPGYVSDQTPFGIKDYSPTGQALYEARRVAKSKTIGKRAPKKFDILGLYFMGSPGTITYNGRSDFDIWVFIAPDIEACRLAELELKLQLIEAWAAAAHIEAYFHLIDPEKFRSGESRPLSQESSGSAQYGLLLDEFYRSSILIAGLPLTWWFVPPQQEAYFDDYLSSQKYLGEADSKDTINLGGLATISPQEYFGAAIWQLNKSIKSPYKSVLKLLLMEVYAHDHKGENLISHRFKKSVYAGITDINVLDPWMLIFEQVEEYLKDQQDEVRLHILRRSFYLKVNEKLSDYLRFDNWQRKLMRQLVRAWGWEDAQITDLDQRDTWKLETVLKERAALVSTLTKSFRFLSRDVRQQSGEIQISPDDLTILGRRLYSAFERKTGKVEIINHGISPDIHESTVSLHLLESHSMSSSWVLYRGIVTTADLGDSTHLKITTSLIEMLCWGYFNQILSNKSKIMLYLPADNRLSEQELRTLMYALQKQFPEDVRDATDDDLSRPVLLKSVALIVNAGLQPRSDPFLADTHLSSGRNNALSYGGQHENLTITFDLVYASSWGEVFVQHYSGINALLDCLAGYLTWFTGAATWTEDLLKVHCYSPSYGNQIRNTLNRLFNDIIRHLQGSQGLSRGRYLLEIEEEYKSIEIQDDLITYKTIPDNLALMEYLAEHRSQFSPLYIDSYACQKTVLPALYQRNKEDTVQLFFYLKGNRAKVYLLDEKGTLFFHPLNYSNKHSLFVQYKLFSDAVIERIELNDFSALLNDNDNGLITEMHLIRKDRIDGFLIEPLSLQSARTSNFLGLQVLYQSGEAGNEQITLYYEDQEFSSLQYGDDLFQQVALHVLKHSKNRLQGHVPSVYITDIDLSQSTLSESDDHQFQSAQYFEYKADIEAKLITALQKL